MQPESPITAYFQMIYIRSTVYLDNFYGNVISLCMKYVLNIIDLVNPKIYPKEI